LSITAVHIGLPIVALTIVAWFIPITFVEAPLEEVFSITEKAAALMEQWKPREG